MISSFTQVLKSANLEFDATDIADILWLAQFIQAPVGSSDLNDQQGMNDVTNEDISKPETKPALSTDQPAIDLLTPQSPTTGEQSSNTPAERKTSSGVPFAVPASPAIRTRLDLARALRPLMRKVPSQKQWELDETATVNEIAQTQIWNPVVKPAQERWLELDLVVEESKTTDIWERVIEDLNQVVQYQGAFRAVRTWRLSATSGQVQIFPRWNRRDSATNDRPRIPDRPKSPRELIDPTGRRLIWLVTDCTSDLWRQSQIFDCLRLWSKGQPIAILQLFPERFWSRTALSQGHLVRLWSHPVGLKAQKFEVEGIPRRLQRKPSNKLVTVPIVSLDVESVRLWSRVLAGSGDAFTPGRTFNISSIDAAVSSTAQVSSTSEKKAYERVALFRATSSDTAITLANLMAAAPVSLPVIDLLREAFRDQFTEEVLQAHVAEVLLSGLLHRCDRDESEPCQYAFWGDNSTDSEERVRDILLGDASIRTTVRVLNELSACICRKLGCPVKTFEALLQDIQDLESELRNTALPFAKVGVDVLRRLGGEYENLAERYGQTVLFPQLDSFEFIDAIFSENEFTDFPPHLATGDFAILTLQPEAFNSNLVILEAFDFNVATLEGRRGKWTIQQRQHSAQRYLEHLSSDTDLEMVSIQGGTFRMGSPKDELERFGDEGPQHQVTVESFFLGRYPITQAQWRVVANLPQIERELETDPARFKGDNRPIEKVSWFDAIEFCDRLSRYTGREYRLPTESEWEYACRAGTISPFHFGDMITPEIANFNGSAYADGPTGESREATTPVDHFGIANAFGLSDMHGNVWEWCQDHWHDDYDGGPTDGSAWISENDSAFRVRRGGSWDFFPRNCRSAYRFFINPESRDINIGFRVVCSAPRSLP
ncbi:formylglycine-generating enzyme family protein [Acaryochloris marina]|uniref:formylglycine-generating enzyme family protein n=1 Tax=Acaryochloris marina TaxID=155978 RepID=UPI0021C4A4FE|nr:formylglycine-generating enzyme family protein [Acaryochloris marina]BDM82833.1 hypothetical protein AM10699_56940 [Acaryochloris marina MBIC10699]